MNNEGRVWRILRIVGWSVAAGVLLLPLVAMLFTQEVNWGLEDFVFAGLLLGGSGLLFEWILRRSNDDTYRTGALLALAAMVLLVWSNAAVGFVGSGANVANVLYFALVAIPLLGGFVSGFTARGMFLTLILTAIVQVAITGFVFLAGFVSGAESGAVLAINAIFILVWLGAAALFHRAASDTSVGKAPSMIEPLHSFPIRSVLSLLVAAIGAVMLTYMVLVENEAGMVPLLVTVVGTAGFLLTIVRSGSRRH